MIATVHPRELESAPPPVMAAEDEPGDFILDHPLVSENFDVVYESNEVIPPALDIVAMEITRDGDNYCFHIRTAGENLPELLQAGRRSTQFGVYVDGDRNGASVVLLSTTIQLEHGIVFTPDFEVIADMPRLSIEGNLVTMCVSRDEVGDHFEWVVSSGYSPREGAYYRTPIETVFIVPGVDMAYPNPERIVLFHTPLSGSGTNCQVTGMGVTTCPPPGTPPNNPPGRTAVPGSSCQGWMYQRTHVVISDMSGGVTAALSQRRRRIVLRWEPLPRLGISACVARECSRDPLAGGWQNALSTAARTISNHMIQTRTELPTESFIRLWIGAKMTTEITKET